MVGVAQLARAPGCGPGGRGFKPRRPPQKCGGAYSETSAPHTLGAQSCVRVRLRRCNFRNDAPLAQLVRASDS